MCIRDRSDEVLIDLLRNGLLAYLAVAHFGRGRGEWIETEPVSYTHLRAHETVLDLVCRLLLDKKQHNNNNNIISTKKS